MPIEARRVLLPGGADVSYLCSGKRDGRAAPVVMLHGLGGSAAVWKRNLPALRGRQRFAPELWGPGRFAPGAPLSVDLGVRFVLDFMEALSISSAHLIGGSLGGLIAAMAALRTPSRVRSLTLIASAGLGRQIAWSQRLMTLPGVGEFFFRPTEQRVRALLKLLLRTSAPPEDLVAELWAARSGHDVTRQMLSALRAGVGLRGVKRSAMLSPYLDGLATPTLVCWGSNDPLFPIEQARTAVERMPNARLAVFEGAGHWPFYEQADAFNAALLDHVRHAEAARPPTGATG